MVGIAVAMVIISKEDRAQFVMMTAYVSDEMAVQTQKSRASALLGKPFDFDELRQPVACAIT